MPHRSTDCLDRIRCYRCGVPNTLPQSPRPAFIAAVAVAMLLTGCAAAGPINGGKPAASASDIASPVQTAPWWRNDDDPVLASLIADGIAADTGIACLDADVGKLDRDASARTIGGALHRLLQGSGEHSRERSGMIDDLAARRLSLSWRIASTYVEARRLLDRRALGEAVMEQYRDNREVAAFRKDAGLVPAIDEALSGSLEESTRAELGYSNARLNETLAELAKLVGSDVPGVQARIGSPAPVEVGNAVPLQSDLIEARKKTRQAVQDARTAYRQGAGSIATLYVAEVASLSVEQAIVDASAAQTLARLREVSDADQSWARDISSGADIAAKDIACG